MTRDHDRAKSIEELLDEFRNGDEAAWEEILRRISPLVTRWVNNLLHVHGCINVAEHGPDLMQEVFMEGWMHEDQVQTNFKGWIYRLTVNKVNRHLRLVCIPQQNNLDQLDEQAVPEGPMIDYVRLRENDLFMKEAAAEAKRISERFGEMFISRYYWGESFAEIAKRHDCSEDAARQYFLRKLNDLRKRLKLDDFES